MAKGSYILLMTLPEGSQIKAGRLADTYFPAGFYAYVGSAMGGFASRLNRHCKKNKKRHWHIDYLLERAALSDVILCETEVKVECAIAQALSRQFSSIPGFGSSDCKCPSHLFLAANESQLESGILATLDTLPVAKRMLKPTSQIEGQE
jgi:Uri superfamily endonuclease